MTRLYGFTRDYHFPYYCFGKRCFAFKIIWSRKYRKFKVFFFKSNSEHVLFNMMENSNPIRFFGYIRTNFNTLYNIFND